MKKLLFTLTIVLMSLQVSAQGWPANYGGVMLQGFFWDSWTATPLHGPRGGALNYLNNETFGLKGGYTWATMYGAGWGDAQEWQVPITSWTNLLAHRDEITPYINLIWLPQSGSTICPPTSIYTKASDNSGRNGWRAWRDANGYQFNDGMVINNPDCMGFVPVFYFHHGEQETPYTYTYRFGENDKESKEFTPKSYFGTEKQLRELISTFKSLGTGAVEDVVANHRGCFGTWNFDFTGVDGNNYTYYSTKANLDFPTEWYYGQFRGLSWDEIRSGQSKGDIGSGTDYEEISWSTDDVCSDDESAGEGGHPSGNPDCGGKGEWARDIDHHNPATRAKVVKYLDFLKNDLGYVGFRYDYAMGFEGVHYGEYNTTLRPAYSVGEYWGSMGDISSWIANTYMEGNNQSAAFDFPLMYAINDAFNNGNYRGLKNAGLIGDHDMRRYTVTFVDNHDTAKDLPTDGSNKDYANRTNHNIVQANAFILAMPGTPCMFYPHFMHPDWHTVICNMIMGRRTAGVHNMSEIVSVTETGNNGITWIVQGSAGQVCLQLGDAAGGDTPDGFQEIYHSPNGEAPCRYSITAGLDWQNSTKAPLVTGYPIISRSTCAFADQITINVKPSLSDVTLVYTTDGSEPTATSPKITAATDLTFTATTQLKVGVLTDGVVQSVVSNTYALDADAAQSVTIYVKADDAPNLYLWSNTSDYKPNGSWAGNKTTEVKTVGGVSWHCKTFPLPNYSEGEYYNLIINWDGGSQSHTISGITSDRFFTYYNGQPIDVTENYIGTVLKLEADKEAGLYDNDLDVKLTASASDLTIVYTLDGTAPTAGSAQLTGEGVVKITRAGSHVLRAALLADGNVINELTRTYVIKDDVTRSGMRIFVRTETAPQLYIYNAVTTDQSSVSWPGTELTQTTKDEDGYTWYYYDNEKLKSCDIVLSNGGSGDGNQTEDITGLSEGDHYFVYNGSNYYLDVTNLVHDSYLLFQPSKSTWDKDGAEMQLYISGVGDFMNFTKIGGTNNGDNVYLWYSDNNTVGKGTEICFKRMSGSTQWNWSSSNDGHPSEGYIKGGYYYTDLSLNNGWDNSVALGAANYDNFKYPAVANKIADITDALLYEIEADGEADNYYTVSENLTVGYVDKYGDGYYAFNAAVDANSMQIVGDGEVDYVKDMLSSTGKGNTLQRNWVKLTGSTNQFKDIPVGTVLSNVTGKLIDADNTTIELVAKPVITGVVAEPQLNTYTPCNFAESNTQTGEYDNITYFFFHPQINEVAHIMCAVYKGNGVFEVPERTQSQADDHHWINHPGLTGSITVDLSGIDTSGWTDNGTMAVDFDAIITTTATGGSGAPRRAQAAGSYNIKAVKASDPYNYIVTGVTDINVAAEREVLNVQFVDMTGRVSSTPFNGVNVVVTRFTDGTVSTRKIIN